MVGDHEEIRYARGFASTTLSGDFVGTTRVSSQPPAGTAVKKSPDAVVTIDDI